MDLVRRDRSWAVLAEGRVRQLEPRVDILQSSVTEISKLLGQSPNEFRPMLLRSLPVHHRILSSYGYDFVRILGRAVIHRGGCSVQLNYLSCSARSRDVPENRVARYGPPAFEPCDCKRSGLYQNLFQAQTGGFQQSRNFGLLHVKIRRADRGTFPWR